MDTSMFKELAVELWAVLVALVHLAMPEDPMLLGIVMGASAYPLWLGLRKLPGTKQAIDFLEDILALGGRALRKAWDKTGGKLVSLAQGGVAKLRDRIKGALK